jgi:hypothetical protein
VLTWAVDLSDADGHGHGVAVLHQLLVRREHIRRQPQVTSLVLRRRSSTAAAHLLDRVAFFSSSGGLSPQIPNQRLHNWLAGGHIYSARGFSTIPAEL